MKRTTRTSENLRKTAATRDLCAVALGLACLVVAGCTLAPTYEQPAAPIPAAWPATPAVATTTTPPATADLPRNDFILDDRLRRVVDLALENNRDLRIAALNVDRYVALYQIERSALLPHVNATAGASAQRVAETLSGTGDPEIRRQYSVGVGVTAYELDVFGRVRSLKDAALADYLAMEETQRATRLSLVAAVTQSYLTLAADREQLSLARQTLESRQSSYELIKLRFEAGIASALDLQQAQTTVDAARVASARYTRLVAQDENQLNLLVGSTLPPELLPEGLGDDATLVQDVAPGLPSETLLKRPDIMAAEHRLKGAYADIGAARAAFFPRIALTGSVGFASDQLDDLFKSGAGTWSFIPQISLPIFDFGKNRANLKVSRVDQEIQLARYEQAIQTAFREVADALAERGTIDEQLAAQQSLTDATAESFRLSQARYDKGVDSYLQVLDAQRTLHSAQQNLIATRLTRLANRVALYKAVGGGAE